MPHNITPEQVAEYDRIAISTGYLSPDIARSTISALLDERRLVLEMVARHLANLDSATALERLVAYVDANQEPAP